MRLPPPPSAGFFAEHTAAALAAGLRCGEVSPTELVEQALGAALRLDPLLNAFVTLDEPGARAAARRATAELAVGMDRGPLHGIPIAIKDVVDTAGLRTTMGSRHFADRVPERDAECVRRLRQAGAVIIGKTNTHEFSYGPTGDRAAGGAARNPYRRDHMSGGSSAGSAVAVAAGIVPLSVGTDTGGSVRIPAALCGVVGLKPTHGAVPTDGVFPLSPSLDTVGPIARTATDCRILWQTLTGADVSGVEAVRCAPEAHRLRIGWVPPETFHPAGDAVTGAALESLRHNGIHVRDVAVPDAEALRSAYGAIQAGEVSAIHAERLATAPELYDEEVLERLRAAARVRPGQYARARDVQRKARAAITSLLEHHDLLALPTVPIPAPPLGARRSPLAGAPIDVRAALLSLTSPWSVVGLPALTLPAGLVDGLPVGLQLVAPAGAEDLLLTVARRLHDAVGNPRRLSSCPPGLPGRDTSPRTCQETPVKGTST